MTLEEINEKDNAKFCWKYKKKACKPKMKEEEVRLL